jgi:hypothetical protein
MRMWLVLLVGAIGCSNDGPAADPYKCISAGGEACFQLPSDVLYAVTEAGEVVAPVLGCGAPVVEYSASSVMLSGLTIDSSGDLAVPGVRIETFEDRHFTGSVFDVTSDSTGAWSASVTQLPSIGFTKVSKAGNLDVLHVYERFDIATPTQDMLEVASVTRDEIAARIAAVGDLMLAGKSQLAGIAYDCAGNRLGSAIVNASPVSAKLGSKRFELGVRTYYELEGGASLARRPQLHETSGSGGFAITNLSPGAHFIQLWGFPTAADLDIDTDGLKLLAEYEIAVFEGESSFVMTAYAQ